MSNIKKTQIELAEEKANDIIESCILREHCEYAENYLELFLKHFKDLERYDRLVDKLSNKKLDISYEN